jgi:hypothetical protein
VSCRPAFWQQQQRTKLLRTDIDSNSYTLYVNISLYRRAVVPSARLVVVYMYIAQCLAVTAV